MAFPSNRNSLVAILIWIKKNYCSSSLFKVYSNFYPKLKLQILTLDGTNQRTTIILHILKAIKQEFKGPVPQIVSWLGLSIIWKTIRN